MAQHRRQKDRSGSDLVPVTVRFTPDQLAAIEAAADSLAIDRAQFIRMGALRECGWTPPRPAPAIRSVPLPQRKKPDSAEPS